MKRTPLVALLSVVAMLTVAPRASAAFITVNSIVGPTIDFNTEATANNVIGPVQIGESVGQDITVRSSSGTNGLFFNFNGWGLVGNGTWGNPMTYVGLNGDFDSMIFSFNDGPVSAVGAFMNYANFANAADLMITALDSGMGVLESYNVSVLADIVTPGGFNAGAFRGIQRGSADISYFVVSGGLANVIDDLTFSAEAAVPEPSSVLLLGSGAIGLIALARRRRRQ